MKKNGYSIPELLILVVILGVITLGVVTATSNAFKDNTEDLYNDKIKLITHQAELYGKTLSNLETEGSLIITLDDLINNGYYVTDDDSKIVTDPRNSKASLNGLKIKLVYNSSDDIKASIIEED